MDEPGKFNELKKDGGVRPVLCGVSRPFYSGGGSENFDPSKSGLSGSIYEKLFRSRVGTGVRGGRNNHQERRTEALRIKGVSQEG